MNEEQKAAALDSMRRMASTLPTTRELAWAEIKNGVDPLYVAHKYQLEPDRMLAAKAELDRRNAPKEPA